MNSYRENPAYFKRAVQSYLSQEGVDVELILSTVEGDPCIQLAENLPVVLVVSPQPSIWKQLNAGMAAVTGQWVCYASSNDVAVPTKLITEVNCCLKENKQVCYSAYYYCDQNLLVERIVSFFAYDYQKHFERNFVSDCALFSAALLKKYYPFNEHWQNSCYHDLWLRIYRGEGNVFAYNPIPTWDYRVGNHSRHVQKNKTPQWKSKEKKQKEEMLKTHRTWNAIG